MNFAHMHAWARLWQAVEYLATSAKPTAGAGEFAHYKINGITGRKIAEMIVGLCRQAEGEEPARELSGGQTAAEIIRVAAEKVRLLNSEEPKPK